MCGKGLTRVKGGGAAGRKKRPRAERGWGRVGMSIARARWRTGGGGGCTQFVHGRSRMTMDPRTPTTSGRSTSGFRRPDRHRVRALIAIVTLLTSVRMRL